jgi:hypothetical protein
MDRQKCMSSAKIVKSFPVVAMGNPIQKGKIVSGRIQAVAILALMKQWAFLEWLVKEMIEFVYCKLQASLNIFCAHSIMCYYLIITPIELRVVAP